MIVGITAAAGLLALLGLAAASGGGAAAPKKRSKIDSLIANWGSTDGSILYYWDGYLKGATGDPIQPYTYLNGKTIKLQLMLQGTNTWKTIATQTTRNPGIHDGYFFFYVQYPKPVASKVRIIFEGDNQYEGTERSYVVQDTPVYPVLW